MKLLFIHGAGGTKSKWRKVAKQIQGHSCECIDLPGHGESEYNIISSIQDIACLMSSSIQEETIVIGHSMGGLIAIELAARNNKVKGIVLAASFYELPVHSSILERLETGEFPNSLFYASYSKEVDKDLLEEEQLELKKVPTDIALADFKACNEYTEGKAQFTQLTIPTMAVIGTEDRLLPPQAIEKLKDVKTDIYIQELTGAGHYVMLEKPAAFMSAIQAFVKKVQKQTV